MDCPFIITDENILLKRKLDSIGKIKMMKLALFIYDNNDHDMEDFARLGSIESMKLAIIDLFKDEYYKDKIKEHLGL